MKKRSDIFLCALCLVLSAVIGVAMLLGPAEAFSERENRVLSRRPTLTPDSLASGEFSRGLGKFFEDQFPLREYFTTAKAFFELALGRGENNGVIYADDGYLIIKPSYGDMTLLEENLEQARRFCADMEGKGIETAVFFAPRGIDVLGEYLPQGYPFEREEAVWRAAEEILPGYISANDEIRELASGGEYVWYKTDHHWTPLGAYKGYEKIVEAFGTEAAELSEFRMRSLSDEFYGSVDSRSGNIFNFPDELFIFERCGGGECVLVNHDLGEVYGKVYFEENLSVKDKYKVFMGGNFGHLSLYYEGETERETLLIIKDSFANCAIPFLAENYDLEIYDLRYFDGRISDEITGISPDKVLILYGIDTAATDGSLKRLGR